MCGPRGVLTSLHCAATVAATAANLALVKGMQACLSGGVGGCICGLLGQGLGGGLKCLLDFLFGGGDFTLRELIVFGGEGLGLVVSLVTCEELEDQMMLQLASRT